MADLVGVFYSGEGLQHIVDLLFEGFNVKKHFAVGECTGLATFLRKIKCRLR
jgi:hypothetical protein